MRALAVLWCRLPCRLERRQGITRDESALLGLAVLVELRDVSPEVVEFALLGDAGEHHFDARYLGLGVLDVFLELRLVPGDTGILHGVRIGVACFGTGLASVQAIEVRPDLVRSARADGMTGHALM